MLTVALVPNGGRLAEVDVAGRADEAVLETAICLALGWVADAIRAHHVAQRGLVILLEEGLLDDGAAPVVAREAADHGAIAHIEDARLAAIHVLHLAAV